MLRKYEPNNYGEHVLVLNYATWTDEVSSALDDTVDYIECMIISHGQNMGSSDVADWNGRINTCEREFTNFVTKISPKINSQSRSQNEDSSKRDPLAKAAEEAPAATKAPEEALDTTKPAEEGPAVTKTEDEAPAAKKDSKEAVAAKAVGEATATKAVKEAAAKIAVNETKAEEPVNIQLQQFKIPDQVGGEAHVLVGILYKTWHPTLHSGIFIAKLKFASRDNLYTAVQFAQKLSMDEFEDSTGVKMFYDEEDVSENEADHEDVTAEVNDYADNESQEIIEEDPGKILHLTKLDPDEDHHDARKQSLAILKTVEGAEVNLDTGQDYHEGEDGASEDYVSIEDVSEDDASKVDASIDDASRDDASRDDAMDNLREELEPEVVAFSNA